MLQKAALANSTITYNTAIVVFFVLFLSINEMASPEMMEIDDRPPSRPLTPNEQMDIMLAIETEDIEQTGIPSDRDLEV